MQLSQLPFILHLIFIACTRMIQGQSPLHINFQKLAQYPKPWILLRFSVIRFLYILLITIQSYVLLYYFDQPICMLYYLWFSVTVAWVYPFTKCRFQHSFYAAILLTLISLFIVVHFPMFVACVLWSVYVLYISSWYRWCLPI